MIAATMVDDIVASHLADVRGKWQPFLEERLAADAALRRREQSSHWDWQRKVDYYRPGIASRFFALECDGATQGLMIVDTATMFCQVEGQKGKPLVYVHYVSTAPWNLPSVTDRPIYAGVGSVLIAVAVQLSIDEEFQGRVGLQALPQAVEFYRRLGFSHIGESGKPPLPYFELTEEAARRLLGGM